MVQTYKVWFRKGDDERTLTVTARSHKDACTKATAKADTDWGADWRAICSRLESPDLP